jgi:hypothetical protein
MHVTENEETCITHGITYYKTKGNIITLYAKIPLDFDENKHIREDGRF